MLPRSAKVLLALVLLAALPRAGHAADEPTAPDPAGVPPVDADQAPAADQPPPPVPKARRPAPPAATDPTLLADLSKASSMQSTSVMESLINRLVQRGALTKQDSAELMMMAEADAADARAQAALTQAAIAVAAAAQARARAIGAQAGFMRDAPIQAAAAAASTPSSQPASETASETAQEPAAEAATAPVNDDVGSDSVPQAPAPRPHVAAAGKAASKSASHVASVAPEAPVPDDVVRVTYVPEYVKNQLRQEVTQDVLDDGRKEGWATPNSTPEWISRFTLFGDIRFRSEMIRYPQGNDDTGAFPNFNAINTGAPFNTSGGNFPPELNVDQDRTLLRLRVRLGAAVDLGQSFTVGVRLGTGNDDQPVSENQTLGAANSAQGGDFSKYAVWLDRAFLKYEVGGKPDEDVTAELGRFDNPFFGTSMIWADDLGFDGAVAMSKYHVGEDITPFLTLGAFPVFNTDLNFASNQPAKFSSYNKWLYGAQLGTTFDMGKSMSLKLAVADYHFHNIEGQLSAPFTPLTTADIGDTDDSRPSFAQTGNTYMALRDIAPGPQNDNGTIDQFQYYGLASKFDELALDGRLDFNQFEPFQISLQAEYVKNRGFNAAAVSAIAVNNFGPTTSTAVGAQGPYQGSASAWLIRLTLGDAILQAGGDWNVNLGYRTVGSDAVVDGFADADFGGGGTNFKGPTLGGNVAFTPDIWLGIRWMSASQVGGPALKNDIIFMDLNAKF